MATISQNPSPKHIQGQIADSLGLTLNEETIEGRAQRLCLRLKNEKKILIILDDVWAILDLTNIGIPFGDDHKSCTILLTTRRQQVCSSMGCQSQIPLDILNEEEGLILLRKHCGIHDDSPTLNDMAKEVVQECKGLPLAIVTIGNALRGKATDEWKVVSKKLKMSKLMDVESIDRDVYACLKLSYDYLKGEETKFCFLLCSLFPEDYEIDLEELLRFGLGLDLFQDANFIEDARSQLRVTINNLKASCLLVDAGEGFVKMHDLVRDVALWIASKGENVFMVKAGMILAEWPKQKDLEQCTAISLLESEIGMLPNQLVCPKLKILLLDGDDNDISNEFFEVMKELKVLHLKWFHLSLNSLQPLTNLVMLQLIDCQFRDMSSLKMLAKLEILVLSGHHLVELPEELRELNNLRMLDITHCYYLKRIPVNVIASLSRLEELYIGDNSFKAWEVEGTNAKTSNASLSELCKLSRLTILSLYIEVLQHLPKDVLSLTNLSKYDIRVNTTHNEKSFSESRSLRITNIGSTSLFAFKALYANVEYLKLEKIMECYQNIIPSIDETGLIKLKRLSLKRLQEVECIIDMTQQHVPSIAFSNMVNLHLYDLPNLRYMWKGPTLQVNLQNLTVVELAQCNKLRYVFTLNLARSLLQLQKLKVENCDDLEHIVEIKAEETGDDVVAKRRNDVLLPKLRTLKLKRVEKLINFCSENYSSTWPALQKLFLWETPSLLVAEFGANIQTAKETLRTLGIGAATYEFFKATMAQLKNNFQILEKLYIILCRGVQVIFEVEQQSSLSSLKELKLDYLEDLKCLYKGPPHLLSLPNLQLLEVGECKKLRHLLSSTLARNLLRLERISISDCGELEQLIVEDDRDDHVQLPLFSNLSSIYVSGCDKLKTLFPVSIARRLDLQQLISPIVQYSPQLEEIFGQKDEANMMTGDTESQLLFPQLQKLTLESLESLVNFCPPGYHFIFPSLSWLVVKKCPKITTIFSVDQNGIVHAQAQAPHADNQHLDMEHSPPEIAGDIMCWNLNQCRETLPPYSGK